MAAEGRGAAGELDVGTCEVGGRRIDYFVAAAALAGRVAVEVVLEDTALHPHKPPFLHHGPPCQRLHCWLPREHPSNGCTTRSNRRLQLPALVPCWLASWTAHDEPGIPTHYTQLDSLV